MTIIGDIEDYCIHNCVSRNAVSINSKVAISAPDWKLTWEQLSALGNTLAVELSDQGVLPGNTVTIIANRTLAIPIGILGILRAGCIFNIIDGSYPTERIEKLLNVANPSCILDATGVAKLSSERQGVDISVSSLKKRDLRDFELNISPASHNDPACLTFTSGSSGMQRAVLGRHIGLTAFLPWQAKTFKFDSSDVVAMLSGLSHDPLQRDIFTSWWSGASLAVPPVNVYDGIGRIAEWMNHTNVSICNLTPSLARLVSLGSRGSVAKLRLVFLVGEVIKSSDIANIQAWAPNAEIVGLYGATETQRALLHHRILPGTTPVDPIPLGIAPPGMEIKIIDEAGLICTDENRGQICIKSPYIALGYKDGSEGQGGFALDKDGTTVYYTGDIGSVSSSGALIFHGRKDRQIKIRGFRIDLAEIEAAACQLTNISSARAKWWPETQSLILYVVWDGSVLPVGEFLAFLKRQLPQPAIPTRIIALPEFPLSQNGKVNDALLPDPRDEQLPLIRVS